MRWERRRRAIVPSSPCPAEVSFILERRKLGLDIKSCGRWQRKSVRFYWDNQVSRRVNPSLSRAIGPPRKPRRWRRLRWKSWTTPSEATRGPPARCSEVRATKYRARQTAISGPNFHRVPVRYEQLRRGLVAMASGLRSQEPESNSGRCAPELNRATARGLRT